MPLRSLDLANIRMASPLAAASQLEKRQKYVLGL